MEKTTGKRNKKGTVYHSSKVKRLSQFHTLTEARYINIIAFFGLGVNLKIQRRLLLWNQERK